MQTSRPQEDALGTPDDPPPVYEATPNHTSEQTLAYGPLRPFQPPPPVPGRPYQQQHPPQQSPHSPGPTLPPPSFPFWNGAGLTPQQTGFQEGPVPASFAPPPHPPPGHHPSSSSSSSFAPPPGPPPQPNPPPPQPPKWQPTTVATPGQPLMNKGRVLVYPPGHFCSKCGNTGYKQNDPSHPCRKDWEKYSKPFTAAFRLAPDQEPAANFQKPLRAFALSPPPPSQFYGAGGAQYPSQYQQQQQQQMGGPRPQILVGQRPPPNANVLVLRPGDPRMGGALCRNCGGRGNVVEFMSFFGDEETCPVCRGAGRVF